MKSKHPISFTMTVRDEDWDLKLGGWRCPALKIPGAKIESVYVSSERIDSARYEVKHDLDIIRWIHPERPSEATIQIKLTEELSTEELTSKWKKLAIILPLFSSIIVAFIAGYFSYISGRLPPSIENSNIINLPSSCEDKIKIIYPLDNQTVPIPLKVTGTYQNLSQEQKIYSVIYSTDVARYYPQLNPVIAQSDNTWSCDVSVGLDNNRDKGKKFTINAVLADKSAQKELNIYIDRVKDTNDSQGLKSLPAGTKICSVVTVHRE